MNMMVVMSSAETIRVEKLTKPAEIDGLSAAWRSLGANSFAPAGSFLQPWLAPALKAYGPKHPAEILALWQGNELCGLFALQTGGGPLKRAWVSPLSFSGTPLIAAHDPASVLQAFLGAQRGRAIQLRTIPASGPFWDMLVTAAASVGGAVEILNRWERAALAAQPSFEDWFSGNFERKRRKEFRRLRSRLGEEGRLESLAWAPGDPVDPWVDELIALEALGWKGRRGTALATDVVMANSFRDALHHLAGEGSLRFWKIAFNGKPIAMMSGIVKGDQGWLGKIAYDESFARYSPGVMLILDATERLIDKERLALVDSCAIPGHPMISNIWRDRIALCDVMIRGPGLPAPAFRLLVEAEKARVAARAMAKSFFYRVMRRKES
ncbi:GNAT family N-acetyltransferase [Aestuariivirga sp. YIM B02566]|uniref:GNAT family N-acetyltransferase n=1 Tax=Taklimakanibacter albus TaxID=2800327 RepID=A0ACC5R6M3_9HYPH|nr:GNAT family N-acetyltransferase [Aestuariivirga sp. YIM B02566]MBK1868304.1 GNAT family N-acetyltransferase [Aestuariivirga sp. YIM B02566]